MELRVQKPTFPEIVEFNYEELKQEITTKSSDYVNLVYADEQIPEAKKDRANLNKLVNAMDDERKRIKKECMKPYEDFESKIKELNGIVNIAIKNIDGQIKSYEEKKKQEKLETIKEYYSKIPMCEAYKIAKFEMIFDEKWLNASVSMKSIQTQIEETLAKIESDLATLQNLPEFAFEAIEEYKTSLNLSKAIQEGQRLADIQRRKQEQEAEQARLKAEAEFAQHMNPPVEEPQVIAPAEPIAEAPQRQWISFKANLTREDALALKEFFNSRNIEYAQI